MKTTPNKHARLKLTGLTNKEIVKLREKFGEYQRGMNRIIWVKDPDVNGENLKAYQSGWLRDFKIGDACYLSTKDNLVQGSGGVGGGFVGFFYKEDNL